MRGRWPLALQLVAVVGVFAAALATLWRAGSAVADREANRGAVSRSLAEAGTRLADSGRAGWEIVPPWPGTLDESEWDILDEWFGEQAAESLGDLPGLAGGFYEPASGRFLGTYQPTVGRPTGPGDIERVEDQIRSCLESDRPVAAFVQAGPEVVAIAARPVQSRAGVSGAVWSMTRLDDAPFLGREARHYRQAAAIAIGGIALALAMAAGLAMTVRRQDRERERLRAELARHERLAALGKLVAGLAHEIRNPLAGLRSTVQLWRRGLGPDPESIADVEAEVGRLEGLVTRLLPLARVRPGPVELRADLNALVEEAARLAEPHAADSGVTIRLDPAAGLPTAEADPAAVVQIVRNLTANAIEAMPGGGTLRIGTRSAIGGDAVELIVADTGPGLSTEALRHLFEPFHTTKSGGTGLGLTIGRELARALGGDLVALPPGREPGARFVLRLPIAPRDDPSKPTEIESRVAREKIEIGSTVSRQ